MFLDNPTANYFPFKVRSLKVGNAYEVLSDIFSAIDEQIFSFNCPQKFDVTLWYFAEKPSNKIVICPPKNCRKRRKACVV